MNLENVKYDAFISYRHCELDKFVAENLHKQLESFKVPKSLIKSGKTNGRTKIERVFRDRDELPLASNLADPITKALQSSDYLIVICSPRLPESKWCLKEIETFIKMHGREHVLAVLIEGEPDESFPEVLRYDEKEVTDSDGNPHTIRVDVEPLAADVRGKDKDEVLKQIKNELMRLVAPMLGCNYDDLRMRHKEARQKRILRISLAVSIVCLIFTAISTTMALTINKQSKTIEEQYRASLVTQAISYASISQTLLEQEDRMAAMAVARMALPDSLDAQDDKPYTSAAEYALSDSLAIYNNGENNYPVRTLEQNSPIHFMKVSPDETTLTTVDFNSIVTVYDIASGKTLDSFAVNVGALSGIDNKADLSYIGSGKLVYVADDGYCIYDIPTQTETYHNIENTVYSLETCGEEYIGLTTLKGLQIVDIAGNVVFSYTYPEGHYNEQALAFHSEQSLCAFTTSCVVDDVSQCFLTVVNYQTGDIIYSTETILSDCDECIFYNDQIIIAGTDNNVSSNNPLQYTLELRVQSFPLDNVTANWDFVKEGSSFDLLAGTPDWENKTLIIAGYDEVIHVNTMDGSIINSSYLGSSIVDLAPLAAEGCVLASTERGEKVFVTGEPNSDHLVMEEFDTSNGDFSDFYYSNEFVAAHHNKSTAINIYQKFTGSKTETLATVDDNIVSGHYSSKQKAFILDSYNSQYFLRHTDSEDTITLSYDDYAYDMFFTGENDEEFVLVSTSSLTYFDTTTGEHIETVSLTEAFDKADDVVGTYLNNTLDHNTLVYYTGANNKLSLYSIKDNSVTSLELPKETNSKAECIGISETADKLAIACTEDNTLSLFDINCNLLAETEINAALVSNVIVSDTANCIIVSHLDMTVTFYNMSDLSVIKTVTNLNSNIENMDLLSFTATDSAINTPVYALYGSNECYLLNKDLELVARLYCYFACDDESQTFYLRKDTDILAVPYYNYDMLIEEADQQLEDYQLSNYRKNQLGL